MSITVLCDIRDLRETIEECKNEWVFQILYELGISEESLMNNDGVFEQARNEMFELGINVEHNHAKNKINVFLEDEMIAEWLPPTVTRYIDSYGAINHYITARARSFLDDEP